MSCGCRASLQLCCTARRREEEAQLTWQLLVRPVLLGMALSDAAIGCLLCHWHTFQQLCGTPHREWNSPWQQTIMETCNKSMVNILPQTAPGILFHQCSGWPGHHCYEWFVTYHGSCDVAWGQRCVCGHTVPLPQQHREWQCTAPEDGTKTKCWKHIVHHNNVTEIKNIFLKIVNIGQAIFSAPFHKSATPLIKSIGWITCKVK